MQRTMLLAVFSAVVFAGCTGEGNPGNSFQYAEIVEHFQECSPYCSREFLLTDDGTIYLREEKLADGGKQIEASLRSVGANEAKKLIDAIRATGPYAYSPCNNCDSLTVLSYDTNASRHTELPIEESGELKGRFQEIESLYYDGSDNNEYFIHFGFSEDMQAIPDYHIYGDGKIIFENFSIGKMANAKTWKDKLHADKWLSLINNVSFIESNDYSNCRDTGLVYGFLEVSFNGQFLSVFTCGGKNGAHALFSGLLAELGGKK